MCMTKKRRSQLDAARSNEGIEEKKERSKEAVQVLVAREVIQSQSQSQ